MNRIPTHEDAKLILQLYEMRREARMRQAREWFASEGIFRTLEDFDRLCPVGSGMNANFRMVTTYWEMVASFVTSGVLHKELFFKSGRELLFCYERVRDILPALRERHKNPGMLAEVEAVAKDFIEYLHSVGPETYATFSKTVRRE